VTAEQGLEGIVAKRMTSTWLPGRRSPNWVKTKHRRREHLVITGWRTRTDEPEEFLVARTGVDGNLHPAGSVSMGLDRDRRAALLEAVASAEDVARRRGGLRFSAAAVEVAVDCHGRLDGPVRDAILREVHLDGDHAREDHRGYLVRTSTPSASAAAAAQGVAQRMPSPAAGDLGDESGILPSI
jgi:ATP-dependent DNA ligase